MDEFPTPPQHPRLLDRFLGVIERAPLSDRLGLRTLFFIAIAATLLLLIVISGLFSGERGVSGGSFTEGMLGMPRFVNPALALTRTDQDLTMLLYSGLMRIGADGSLTYDLAEDINLSEDGRTYTVKLREGSTFHDGSAVTAADVLYTIRLVQDPALKSPVQGNWSQVDAQAIDDYTLTITLDEAYSPFIENFTLGVMPAAQWRELLTEELPFAPGNTQPTGSGPYQINKVARDADGLIESYELIPHTTTRDTALIARITVDFFSNELELREALVDQDIDATAHLSVESLVTLDTDVWQILSEPLPRIFGIFFNQNESVALRDTAAREALGAVINRQTLIDTTLASYGVPSTAPTVLTARTVESAGATTSPAEILTEADWTQTDLGGWEKDINDETTRLSLTLRTSNTPLFARVAEAISADWRSAGVDVVVEQYEQSDLVQGVIRPREFEALLFGLDMSRSHDLYPFWHSSQQNDPGLNISQYTNITVDDLLETARLEQNPVTREESLSEASDIIVSESPAIFLFQPTLVYVVSKDIAVSPVVQPGRLADRFANVHLWYIEEESLWPFFK